MYKCKCGKQYKNLNGLQAHQNHHCKLYLDEEKYNQEREHLIQMSLKSGKIAKEKASLKKQKNLEQ